MASRDESANAQALVRRIALSLPETTEEPHFELASFRVRGKIFVTLPPAGDVLHVFLDEHETNAVGAHHPSVYSELWWGKRLSGLRCRLDRTSRTELEDLLETAWRRGAPKRVVAAHDQDRSRSSSSSTGSTSASGGAMP